MIKLNIEWSQEEESKVSEQDPKFEKRDGSLEIIGTLSLKTQPDANLSQVVFTGDFVCWKENADTNFVSIFSTREQRLISKLELG